MAEKISDIFLKREEDTLSPYAFLTKNTRGRDYPYVPCENRTEFQRDRDRIIHSKSFRRLMHKTQVFLFPADEHYRTRMTHTLEVTQVARIIARALRLNEDLTEAAAMGHDLGHTPFGHAARWLCSSAIRRSLRIISKAFGLWSILKTTARDSILRMRFETASSITRETAWRPR